MVSEQFENLDTKLLKQNGKIIHQIWFGTIPTRKKAALDLEKLSKYKKSWTLRNPSIYYHCWNWENSLNLVRNHFPQYLQMFNEYPHPIQKCDLVRYFILYRYGGLYADMDYYCNSKWEEVINKYQGDIYFVETPNRFGNDIQISNSLMYSRIREHNFWPKLFVELEKARNSWGMWGNKHMKIMFSTGPGILSQIYHKYKFRYKLKYYPWKLFHPFGIRTEFKNLSNLSSEIRAVHMGKGSWESGDSKFLLFLYQEYKIILFSGIVLLFPYLL